jgi:phospholipase C
MPELNRRRFLQFAGGTAAFAMLSESISRAATLPAFHSSGSLQDVEHIVVLMQENRSFDHYFGTMRGVRGFGDPRPVSLPSGKSVWHQQGSNREVLPFHPQADDLGMQFISGHNHSWAGVHAAFNNGKYDRWLRVQPESAMAYLTREDIPFHFALADAFTVCDAYHCSLLGPTDPNRYYMYSGHTGNDGRGGGPVLDNAELGYGWTTYAERLEAAGISWKVYQDIGDGLDAAGNWGWTKHDNFIGNYGDNSLLFFNKFRNARPGNPLYEKARRGTKAKAGDGYFDLLRADVAADRLPQISWIAAPGAFTEHPIWPANYGAWYIANVLDALTSNPQVWGKTALFVTYDEHDGYFDHVVPPYVPVSAAQGRSTVSTANEYFPGNAQFPAGHYGMGHRVPMFVVSPWSTGGYVCSEVFDHTSIIRFMEQRFGVHEPNITRWRRTVAGDLTSAFDFSGKNTGRPALPDTAAYEPPNHESGPRYVPLAPANPALPKQEPGYRPTRPLPYTPYVDSSLDAATGRLTLTFSGGPRAGACFHVRPGNRPNSYGPWTYTTEAGRTISDVWSATYPGGSYDLSVFGPNGFLRVFKGPGSTAEPEVTARHDNATGNLTLILMNTGATDVDLTMRNAYGGAERTLRVMAFGIVDHTVDLRASNRWYDITIVSGASSGFLRRLAGHVENGRTGVSDPAIAAG